MKVIENIVLYSIEEIAMKLNCTYRTITNYIQKGLIRSQTVNKETLISKFNFQLFLNANMPLPYYFKNTDLSNEEITEQIKETFKEPTKETFKEPTKETVKETLKKESTIGKMLTSKETAELLGISVPSLNNLCSGKTKKINPTHQDGKRMFKSSEIDKYIKSRKVVKK